MKLNISDEHTTQSPTTEMVVESVANLNLDEFAVLASADETYLQTYHNSDGTFQLEYREGSFENHYAASETGLTHTQIADVFAKYASGDSSWKSDFSWEKVEFDADFEGDLHVDNSYLIEGTEYRRVQVGQEKSARDIPPRPCPICGIASGEFHTQGCELEECPRCHDTINLCGCE